MRQHHRRNQAAVLLLALSYISWEVGIYAFISGKMFSFSRVLLSGVRLLREEIKVLFLCSVFFSFPVIPGGKIHRISRKLEGIAGI